MPYFRRAPATTILSLTHPSGERLGEILVSIVRSVPGAGWGCFDVPKLVYMLALLAPLASCRSWPARLRGRDPSPACHEPAERRSDPDQPRSQYQSFVLPFLLLAMVDGFRAPPPYGRHPRPGIALGAALFFSLILTSRTFNDLLDPPLAAGPGSKGPRTPLDGDDPWINAVSANERLVPTWMREQIFVYPRAWAISSHIIDLSETIDRSPPPWLRGNEPRRSRGAPGT